jgi:hypothetical protein
MYIGIGTPAKISLSHAIKTKSSALNTLKNVMISDDNLFG